MLSLSAQFKKFRDRWFQLCTGRPAQDQLDEEHYRQRILVMTSGFWLFTVIALTAFMPVILELTPEGRLAANILLSTTGLGVLFSMLILRYLDSRIMALNVMLVIYTGAFIAACFVFGGTQSPTYPLLLLAPAMAGIVGGVFISVSWGLVVLAFWVGVLVAERSGFQFVQIIAPQNHSVAMVVAYATMAAAVVSIIIIYAEMNKELRNSLQGSNAELAHLSTHDQLTGLPNRRFYDERIALSLERAAKHGGKTGLLFLDMNDFKQINDTHGHGAGDRLLIAVAQRIQANVRETDLVARLGGDEFVAVLEDIQSAEQVTRIAHKLAQAIEQPLSVRNQQLQFSASIGVAIFPTDGRQLKELEEQADKAMYQAKKRGIPVALSSLESTSAIWPARQPQHLI